MNNEVKATLADCEQSRAAAASSPITRRRTKRRNEL